MLLLIGVWVFFMRQMQSGGGRAMGFGKSRARMLTEKQGRVTFDDVAGIDEAKSELQEIVEFLKDPQKFQRLGGKIPKGVLLVGPARHRQDACWRAPSPARPTCRSSPSRAPTSSRCSWASAPAACATCSSRARRTRPASSSSTKSTRSAAIAAPGLGGGNDEREQTLNQMLVEMDGFESNEGVILIAATNRPDVLDPALLRPGRFDRQVVVPNPDVNGREKILRVHMRKVPLASDVDPKVIARGTPGFSGADLANLVNEAALLAARIGKRVVAMAEFEHAKDKVMMGAERRVLVMSEAEKKMTAYHEAGHALCAMHEPECDPVHKATIIPRGRALGLVMSLPEGDRYSKSKSKLLAELTMAMGGRAAEEIMFGADNVSNGAAGDIKMATDQARRMVTEWGMSDKLGMIAYGDNSQEVFLGHSVTQNKNVSEVTAREIDAEIKGIIDTAYARAKHILTDEPGRAAPLAQGLLEHETLSGDEIRQVLRGEPVIKQVVDDPMPESRRASVPPSSRPRPAATGWRPRPGPAAGLSRGSCPPERI